MDEQNPLMISAAPAVTSKRNLKGRPRGEVSVMFGPQPESIVSQLLKKMIAQNKIIIPIEQDTEKYNVDSNINEEIQQVFITNEETDVDDNISCPIPKKKSSTRRKKEARPKIFTCDYPSCTYNTKLSCNLQKHKRTHTGEKPYLCDRCSFKTSFSNSLRVHNRLHTAERPYHCMNCDYKCNSVSNLKKHIQSKHEGLTCNKSTPN